MHKNQDVTSDQSTADSGHKTETHLSSHTVISKDSTTVTNHDLTPGTGINKEDIPKPKGYVIRDNTFLHAFSDTASKKLKRLQKGEFIYLLETSLTNEKGEMVSYPTWYKVTVADKMTGWVRSDHVSFGH